MSHIFDEFRLNFLRELAGTNLDNDSMSAVMNIVDKMSAEFDITHKPTALVPLDQTNQRIVMEYLACRSLEGLSKQTLYNYHRALMRFVTTIRKPIESVEPTDIRLYLYQYQQQREISNRSLDKLRNTISSFFNWMTAEGRMTTNPCAAIKPIKYTVTPRTALTQLELEYIRRACKTVRDHAIVEMLYSTGCRVSELCGLKKQDINWETRSARVFGKGNKYRTVFINAKAYVTLQDYLATRTDNDEHLFVSERKPHQGLKRHAIEKIIRQISARAFPLIGKNVTPHIFRHTTATTALHNGMPVQNISKMLGHEQIETTMIYAEVNKEDLQRDHSRFVV